MALALIVEDNAINLKLLRDILALEFEVIEATSAEAAVELLNDTHPDVIFLDMQLPGMDGLSFAQQLKSDVHTASIPIVAVSAHAMKDDIEQALEAGCTEYITKPITEEPVSLVQRMRKLVPDK